MEGARISSGIWHTATWSIPLGVFPPRRSWLMERILVICSRVTGLSKSTGVTGIATNKNGPTKPSTSLGQSRTYFLLRAAVYSETGRMRSSITALGASASAAGSRPIAIANRNQILRMMSHIRAREKNAGESRIVRYPTCCIRHSENA